MLGSLWGLLDRSRRIVWGRSNPAGFTLNVATDDNPLTFRYPIKFSSRKFLKAEPKFNKEFKLSFKEKVFFALQVIALSAPVIFIFWGTTTSWPMRWLYEILGILSIGISLAHCQTFAWVIKKPAVAEWHACEHKSIALLERGLEPTVENLKKMSMVDVQCGTATSVLGWQIVMAITLWVFVPNVGFGWIAILAIIGGVLVLLTPELPLFWAWLFLPLMVPVIIFPLLIQRLCVVREPSRKKLQETAAELKIFIEAHHLYDSSPSQP